VDSILETFSRGAAVAGVVLLAGCGGSSSAGNSGASSGGASASPSATASGPATGDPSTAVTVREDGSSLVYPYLQKMVAPLAQAFPHITLAPAAGGSGKGISDAIAGAVDMGGSDAYLSAGQASQNPGLLNIPIAVSAQAINYNLPGIADLKLSGDVLAKIYMGKITKWNDGAITALNPGMTLPPTTIVPVRRVDSSGDTFIFTSLLAATNSEWKSGPDYGTTVTWPAVSNELTANGNPPMVQTCKSTPGCVAYVGVSSEQAAIAANLGEVQLQNQAGNFVKPTTDTINAAVAAAAGNTPGNLRQSLIYASGAQSYPIVNYEYLVVKSGQTSKDAALAIRTFLAWAIAPSGGAQFASQVGFVPLPAAVIPKVNEAIAQIAG